jgi:hypothetical protein
LRVLQAVSISAMPNRDDLNNERLPQYTVDHSVITNPELAPLISFPLEDPVYFVRYNELLAENFEGVAARKR